MIQKYGFFLAIIFVLPALARLTDNQIQFQVEKNQISIKPKSGFHLNASAPATVTFDHMEALLKPITKLEEKFVFNIQPQAKIAHLKFYVCDDKKTTCEQHLKTLNLVNDDKQQANSVSSVNSVNAVNSSQVPPSKDVKFDQLIANGKPSLLVFSAPWCPACIRMQTETYPDPKVQKEIKKINFLKLNSDLVENEKLSEKFNIKAIPTLILLNSSGEEVNRWLDFQKAKDFSVSLKSEIQKLKKSGSMQDLIAKAQLGGAVEISKLGMDAYNALNWTEAVKWFSLSKKTEDQKYKLASEVNQAQEQLEKDANLTTEYLLTLEKGITLSSSKLDQLHWFTDWVEKKKEMETLNPETQSKINQHLMEVDQWLKNPKKLGELFKDSTFGDTSGFEVAELLNVKSRLYAAIENKEKKANSESELIKNILSMKLNVDKPGQMLIGIAYLREAGDIENVKNMYLSLIEKFPDTYVYHEKYARFLLKNKTPKLALESSNKALEYANGNEPQLMLLKVRILKELQLKVEALKTIQSTLDLNAINHKKYDKTVAQLNKIKLELETAEK